MQPQKISLIVPAYRQEKTIVKDLTRILGIVDKLRYPAEIICVVDGTSIDKTFATASKFAKLRNNIKVVGYEHNRGKGNAVRFGMGKSSGDIIAFIDAGMDLDPNGLSMLLEHFEWYKADIVVGSKRHPASKVNYPFSRRLLSIGYQILTFLLFNLRVRDTQVGMKFYKREVLEKVLPRLLVKRFAFDIEILAVANYLGFNKIYEAPIEMELEFGKNSTLTSKSFLKNVFWMIWDTLAVFYRLRIMNYYSNKNQRKWVYDPELNFNVNLL
jgi:glycosyltransferase involved in cell wall biosynthesis